MLTARGELRRHLGKTRIATEKGLLLEADSCFVAESSW